MTKKGYLKHKDLVEAWSKGADIQFKNVINEWIYKPEPTWREDTEYRIKPFAPKQGDIILIKNNNLWQERVFIKMEHDMYLCISWPVGQWEVDETGYLDTTLWEEAKPIK
jgi:hypothetical protein